MTNQPGEAEGWRAERGIGDAWRQQSGPGPGDGWPPAGRSGEPWPAADRSGEPWPPGAARHAGESGFGYPAQTPWPAPPNNNAAADQPGYLHPGPAAPGPANYAPQQVCAFHPNRPTALHCTRCGRPACPECLKPASVGFQCHACIAEAQGDVRPARTVSGSRLAQQPVVTISLIAVNVLVYLITVVQSKSPDVSAASTVFRDGALIPDLVSAGQWWRVITSGFLHLSLLHIGSNMLSLYFVGLPLERVLGRWRFLTVYSLSLLGGSALVVLATSDLAPEAGASGAIFGLLGALLVTFRRLRLDPRQLLVWIALNLVITFTNSGISWQAHIGGFVIGAIAGAVMVYPPQRIRRTVQLAGSAALAVVVIAVMVGFAVVHKPTFCDLRPDVVNGQAGIYFVSCSTGT